MPMPLLSKLSLTSERSDTTGESQHSASSNSSSNSSSRIRPEESLHIYDENVSFKLKETVLPLKGSYTVTLAEDDKAAYKISGKMLAMGRKTIHDMDENEIYTLVEAKLSLRNRMSIQDKNGTTILTLQKKGLLPGLGGFTIQGFEGEGSTEPVFEITSNLLKNDFSITDLVNAECVAKVRRKVFSAGALLVGKDCYYVDVEPGADCALMMMFVVALDEVFRDGSGVITGGGLRGIL